MLLRCFIVLSQSGIGISIQKIATVKIGVMMYVINFLFLSKFLE